MINRNIINRDISYDGHDYSEICSRINRWKSLLVDKDAKKGDTVALAIMSVNVNHVAAIFACAELGLKLFIFSRPLSKETLHATKMGQFGPMDFSIVEEYLLQEDYHREMFDLYGGHIIMQNEIEEYIDSGNLYGDVVRTFDPFIFASTSGSTGNSKPIFFTHEETFETVLRNAEAFDFEKESIVAHTMNMHHASALMTYLLPSLVVCDTHYHYFIQNRTLPGTDTTTPESFVDEILDKNISHIIVAYAPVIDLYVKLLKKHNISDMRELKINVSGFTMPKKYYDYAKKLPIQFYSHYGSVDGTIGSPVLMNKVDKNSVYRPKLLGKQIDDFFRLTITEDGAYVSGKLWSGYRKMSDLLDFDGEFYYHNGRNDWSEEYMRWNDEIGALIKEQHGDYTLIALEKTSFLVLWDAEKEYDFDLNTTPIKKMVDRILYLKKQDFQVDTKVDNAQLIAWLKYHYEKV